ncbi:hypothetical protein LWC35_10240 [Pseudonocardia kujensis]|uniref:hypothetical protein n=1 Tax=Pseudonocardia kujensis TaxID=1128675 RepID=UPI001E625393|nr:hypothetical protein [Pseudonocardia kujensis]MCE0763282.1 hypothetical protein [Pseudonocardia kujensis]
MLIVARAAITRTATRPIRAKADPSGRVRQTSIRRLFFTRTSTSAPVETSAASQAAAAKLRAASTIIAARVERSSCPA